MNLCYIDESGTPEQSGPTSHYVLVGLAVPDRLWKTHRDQLDALKAKYNLEHEEIHTAPMIRHYKEQEKIVDFESLSYGDRRKRVIEERNRILAILQATNSQKRKSTQRNYRNSQSYVHLTRTERKQAIKEIAMLIGNWGAVRLFAECIDKDHFDPNRTKKSVAEQAFEQVVTRFEIYLRNICEYGILIHDRNETLERRLVGLMKEFLQSGTPWMKLERVIETPMFVDSQIADSIQLADICAYALRRYLEHNEEELFDLVFRRADRKRGASVGVRHFTGQGCECKICASH